MRTRWQGRSKLPDSGEYRVRPGEEFVLARGVCADVFPAGLVDGKANLRDVVNPIEQVEVQPGTRTVRFRDAGCP